MLFALTPVVDRGGGGGRARRGAVIVALAIAGMVATAVYYVHPFQFSPKSAIQGAVLPAVSPADDVVNYSFLSATVAWAVEVTVSPPSQDEPYWLSLTRDGGRTWHQVLSGGTANGFLTAGSLQFPDPGHGFLTAGDPLRLFRSSDGGAHWEGVDLPVVEAWQLKFGDARHGWLLSGSYVPRATPSHHLYRTDDAGEHWIRLADPPGDVMDVTFRNAIEGWASSLQAGVPHVYSSVDGGKTWHAHNLPAANRVGGNVSFTAVVRLLPRAGVIAMAYAPKNEQLTFTSLDWGSSWREVAPPPGNNAVAFWLEFEDTFVWWASYDGILFKTKDGGQSWTQVTNGMQANGVNPLSVIDDDHAWGSAVSFGGMGLVVTGDGGAHWTWVSVPRPARVLGRH